MSNPIPPRQAEVLENLHRIVMRPVGRRLTPFLDGRDCTLQVNSLIVLGMVARGRDGKPIRAAVPDRPQ